MKTSDSIKELATAIAAASLEFQNIERGRTAKVKMRDNKGEYSYDYADLADVLAAVRGPLAKNGVTISHDCVVFREPLRVETTARLEHSSGEWKESSPLSLPCDGLMSETQQIGSACTYGKRYTVQAILGLSTECDDDGNAASGHDASTERRTPLPPCPKCGKTTSTIKGKPEYGGGLVCFKDGCKHKWSTPEFPACDKQGNPIVEPEHAGTVQKTLPTSELTKPATLPPETTEYRSLANKLHAMGVKTPEDATAVINYAVAGVGKISDMRTLKGECQQIEKALTDCGKTGAEILEAIKKGT